MVKLFSRVLVLAMAWLVVAAVASAQDAPPKKKFDPEARFKAMGAKEVDGKLILKKADFDASEAAKKMGDEKSKSFWTRIAGDADQVDFDTFKSKMPKRGGKKGGGGGGSDSKDKT